MTEPLPDLPRQGAECRRVNARIGVRNPGDFFLTEADRATGLRSLTIRLPNIPHEITLTIIAGPTRRNLVWGWNGDEERPSLIPEILQDCGELGQWYGSLRQGRLIACE